ncbi:lipopolysaccharide kinase InaA family protein [Verrucomicrobiaceae bacterium 227]
MLLNHSITRDDLAAIIFEARQKQSNTSPELTSELKRLELRHPSGWSILKNGTRSIVGSHTLSDKSKAVLKYYYPKNFFKKLNYRVTGSRCEMSWIAGLTFQRLGIPTPTPLYLSEKVSMFGLLNSQSFLATRQFEGISLSTLPPERWANVTDQLKEVFQYFRQHHIAHGDLKASNILVSEQDQISFIDLDATRFLLSGKDWEQAHQADLQRFRRNWDGRPDAAEIFNSCIS